MAERVLDVIALALALASVAVLFGDRLGGVLSAMTSHLAGLAAQTPGWAVALAAVAALALLAGAAWLTGAVGEAVRALASFRDGLASVVRTGRPVHGAPFDAAAVGLLRAHGRPPAPPSRPDDQRSGWDCLRRGLS